MLALRVPQVLLLVGAADVSRARGDEVGHVVQLVLVLAVALGRSANGAGDNVNSKAPSQLLVLDQIGVGHLAGIAEAWVVGIPRGQMELWKHDKIASLLGGGGDVACRLFEVGFYITDLYCLGT